MPRAQTLDEDAWLSFGVTLSRTPLAGIALLRKELRLKSSKTRMSGATETAKMPICGADSVEL